MSLYPTLEDMKVDHMAHAQISLLQQQQQHQQQQPQYPQGAGTNPSAPYPTNTLQGPSSPAESNPLYPNLNDYMGLDLSPAALAQYMPNVVAIPAAPRPTASTTSMMVAPLTGNSVGLRRAEVTHGIRETVLCKDEKGKVGLRVRSINKGVFVVLVLRNSPAALAGLRFGDQILQINGENVAGYDTDKVHGIFKKLSVNEIRLAVRDRPFERTITMHKDSIGHIGFGYKNGRIHQIVSDSSAARNGLLIEQNLLEVNGQNVVGLKDKDISKIIDEGGHVITITIMPSYIYDHMMKHMSGSLVRDFMDHSIADI